VQPNAACEVGASFLLSSSWVLDAHVQPGATFVWDSEGELQPVIPQIGVSRYPTISLPDLLGGSRKDEAQVRGLTSAFHTVGRWQPGTAG